MPPQHYASETTPGLWLHQNALPFSRPKGGDIYATESLFAYVYARPPARPSRAPQSVHFWPNVIWGNSKISKDGGNGN